jgi:hypothetical protein
MMNLLHGGGSIAAIDRKESVTRVSMGCVPNLQETNPDPNLGSFGKDF